MQFFDTIPYSYCLKSLKDILAPPPPPPLEGGRRPPMHTPRNIYLSYVIEPVASNQLILFLNQMNIILNVSI